MTYEEAMNLVARGGVVSMDGVNIYMSVNFLSGMAGKLVTSDNFWNETVFIPSDDDIASTSWTEASIVID
ncbi:TPA: hypothetical protein NPO68_000869 [Klebsiella pneumoniae]|nr:hypothetical protein [Klebsiella pneumoniae]